MSGQGQFEVTTQGLNLRSTPIVRSSNCIAVLPIGQRLNKVADVDHPWWEVTTQLDGRPLRGFVSSSYLRAVNGTSPNPAHQSIAAVHLPTPASPAALGTTTGRAYPLNVLGQPSRNAAGSTTAKVNALGAIIQWLDVQKSARYQPSAGLTYCNIYAYDYCYLAGAYLPRVWWNGKALTELAQRRPVPVQYGRTVHELNANALFDWLHDFGPDFGWKRTFNLEEVQSWANKGGVGMICAQRVDRSRSGHITAVVPETAVYRAVRRQDGAVRLPLQSQAGSVNSRYGTGSTAWWTHNRFREAGLWIHA